MGGCKIQNVQHAALLPCEHPASWDSACLVRCTSYVLIAVHTHISNTVVQLLLVLCQVGLQRGQGDLCVRQPDGPEHEWQRRHPPVLPRGNGIWPGGCHRQSVGCVGCDQRLLCKSRVWVCFCVSQGRGAVARGTSCRQDPCIRGRAVFQAVCMRVSAAVASHRSAGQPLQLPGSDAGGCVQYGRDNNPYTAHGVGYLHDL
jgi:hypothetical protein